MLYALIDQKDEIDLEHFHAAKAVWDYCSESAMFIFSGMTKEQLRVVHWINMRGPATFKQVREDLYKRNKPVSGIRADLDCLVKNGHLFQKGESYVTGQNFGRVAA